jgi:hypothetical protein
MTTTSSSIPAASAVESPDRVDRVTLMGGTHFVAANGGVGWVVSNQTPSTILTLTRLSLSTGEANTTVIDDREDASPQMPILSADTAGHLWFTYFHQLLRINTDDGGIQRWDLPEPPADAAKSDEDWSAGGAGGNAWDARSNSLLFVRVSDHRLYRFDPSDETFSTFADLPIITHALSRISIGADGTIAINGAFRDGDTYLRAAVLLREGEQPVVGLSILSICMGPAGPLSLHQSGTIQRGDRFLGRVAFTPDTNVQFVCDPIGNAFTVGMVISEDGSEGNIIIYRFTGDGAASTVMLPMTSSEGINHVTGKPMKQWGGVPSVETLLPDGEGGVWLVSTDGTSGMPGVDDSPYPTLLRIGF